MKEIRFTASSEAPVTLQKFLTEKHGVSRRLLTRLKRTDGGITRNGETIRTIDTVYPGDIIILRPGDEKTLDANPSLNVPIAFENDSLVIFDKPGGMPVHPSIKHQGDTLGNFFASLYPSLTFRPINRLDRDTSGLCAVAKDSYCAAKLQGHIEKTYYAAVHGHIPECGTIDAPVARQRESIILRCVRDDGKRAVTHFERINTNEKYSLARIKLETGRTHQIRVHFAHIGNPLAGDDLYGGMRDDIPRQALHCGELIFPDPVLGKLITINSPIPDDIKKLGSINE